MTSKSPRFSIFNLKKIFAIFLTFIYTTSVSAVSVRDEVTFEGTLTDGNGTPVGLDGHTLIFTIEADNCAIYSETSNTAGDMNGNIVHRIGSGNSTGSINPYSASLFNGVINGTTDGTTSTVGCTASTDRIIKVTDAALGLSAAIPLSSTPYALETKKLNGKSDTDFLQPSTNVSQTNLNNLFTTLFTTGTSNQVLTTNGSGVLAWLTPNYLSASSTFSGDVSGTNSTISVNKIKGVPVTLTSLATNDILKYNGTGFINVPMPTALGTVINVTGTANEISVSNGTTTPVIGLSDIGTSGNYIKVSVDAKGRVTSGSSSLTAADIPSLDTNKITTGILPRSLGGTGLSSSGTANQILGMNSGNTSLEYKTITAGANISILNTAGLITISAASATSSITNLNGQTSSTQTFATSSSGTTLAFNSAAGVHTLNVPLANQATVTAGLISNADYLNFSSKLTNSYSAVTTALGFAPVSNATLVNYATRANNLSDLANSATARSNLGLGSFATVNTIDLSTASTTGTLTGILPLTNGGTGLSAGGGTNTILGMNGANDSFEFKELYAGTNITITHSTSPNRITINAAAAPNGITSLNGSTSTTQTFAFGTTGLTPSVTTANGAHTFNIPLAATGSVSAGLLSNTDYTIFTNKMANTASAVTTALGYIPASSATLSSTFLDAVSNLSDLTSSATARSNLGLGSLATLNFVDLNNGAQVSGTLAIAKLPNFIGDVTSTAASNTLTLSNTGVSASTYAKVTVDAKGRVTNGAQLSQSDVTTALGFTPANSATTVSSQWMTSGTTINYINGNVGIGSTTPVTKLEVSGGIKIGMESATCALSFAGTLRYNSGNVEYCNGTTWFALGTAGAGITSLNGLTNATQTFAIGTTGTAFGVSSTGSIHTFNIPLAASAGTTAGLISNAEFNAFSGKLAPTLTSGQIFVGNASHVAQGQYITGDISISNTGVVSLNTTAVSAGQYTKITVDSKGRAVSGTSLNYTDVTTALGFAPVSAATSSLSNYILKSGDSMTGQLNLNAGSSSTAPLRLTSGTLTSSPIGGSIEFDGSYLYYTKNAPQRMVIAAGTSTGTISNVNTISTSGNLNLSTALGNTVYINSTTSSTDQNTGALVVTGGVGVSGSINTNGNITAQRLKLAGGTLTQTCNTSEEGMQRYNSNFNTMEFCDGTYWQGVNGVTHCTAAAGVSYTLIGKEGTAGAFCISKNIEAMAIYSTAADTCARRTTTNNSQPTICSEPQLNAACVHYQDTAGADLTNFKGLDFWTPAVYDYDSVSGPTYTSNFTIRYAGANGTCAISLQVVGAAYREPNVSVPTNPGKYYRCCYQ